MRWRRPKDAEDLPFCHVEDRKWTFEATLCKEQTRQFQKICPSSWDFPHFPPGKHPKNMFYIRCFLRIEKPWEQSLSLPWTWQYLPLIGSEFMFEGPTRCGRRVALVSRWSWIIWVIDVDSSMCIFIYYTHVVYIIYVIDIIYLIPSIYYIYICMLHM